MAVIGRSLPVKHPKTHHVEWLKLHQNQVSSGIKSAHLAKEIAAMEAQKKLLEGNSPLFRAKTLILRESLNLNTCVYFYQ